MADLSEIASSQSVKIAGANPSTGAEDNYLEVDTNGYVGIRLYDASGTAIDTNFGTVGAHTIRTASQIGNAAGAADYNTGVTGAQTLRTASNLSDGSGNKITSTTSDAKQALDVIINAPAKATYMAASGTFTPPATPTDMFTIIGSATKVIKILKIRVDAFETTAGNIVFYLKRYSTVNSAGTSTAVTPYPLDINNAAATATTKFYTANPTLGTLTGSLDIIDIPIVTNGGPSSAVATSSFFFDFTNNLGQPLILRGTSDQISINFNGAAKPSGFTVGVTVMFTEE